MADRIGVIRQGELVLVQDKVELMRQLGRKELTLQLAVPLDALPAALAALGLERSDDGLTLRYTYDTRNTDGPGIAPVLKALDAAGIAYRDLQTSESSLEDIFVSLVHHEDPTPEESAR